MKCVAPVTVLTSMHVIAFFNTLGRKKEIFTPQVPGKVGMYSCGPTVYDRASIGNLRSFIFADLLRRTLEKNGFAVTAVMNITDVGHLTDDASSGEDKLEVASKKKGKTAWDIADEYTKLFLADIRRVNNLMPTVIPKATDHIAEQIAMVEELQKNGFTYRTDDGIYFDVAKLPEYGQLSGQKMEEKEGGARVETDGKRSAADFALWKFSPAGEKRHMEWESPWGKGFPGWHIECSAMGEKYLGVPFDIHTGGIDHIAVHHENELAQTLGARGVLEANLWMHNEFLLVDGGKMSKSLGNTYSLDDLEAKGFSPFDFRYFILQAHYRTPQNFTFEALGASHQALNRLIDLARTLEKPSTPDTGYVDRFMARVSDDLDTPGALAVLWELVSDANVVSSTKAATLLAFDEVLGLTLDDVVARPVLVPPSVQALLDERAAARSNKDFSASDRLRDAIAELGFVVEDTAEGQRVKEGNRV